MARYPAATWRPSDKHGYRNDDNCLGLGIVAHSMEGGLTAAFGELDRVDRQASWHFSVAKTGSVYQHIDTANISYASGGYEANRRFWSIEHEGKAGEPLTDTQRIATTALMGWLLDSKNLKPIRKETLFEHREMTAFGSAATACPSGRIPWDIIIAALEDNVPTQAEWDQFVSNVVDADKNITLRLVALEENTSRTDADLYKWVQSLAAAIRDQDATNVDTVIAEIQERLKE